MEMNQMDGKMCKCPHHKMFPLVLLAVGVIALLQNTGVIMGDWFNIVWPIALILFALKKLMKGKMCKCCGMDGEMKK